MAKLPWQLRGMDAGSLKMRVLARYASKAAALAGEALHAAHKLASDGSIRGGPWLKAELTATDWAEISAVDACTSEKTSSRPSRLEAPWPLVSASARCGL